MDETHLATAGTTGLISGVAAILGISRKVDKEACDNRFLSAQKLNDERHAAVMETLKEIKEDIKYLRK